MVLDTSAILAILFDEPERDAFVRLIAAAEIEVQPVTAEHAGLACDGFRRFGKRRHAANLNFGDAFAYALAKASAEPLLLKGNDFARTDVASAVPPPKQPA